MTARWRTLLFGVTTFFASAALVGAQSNTHPELTVEIVLADDKPDAVMAIMREVDARNVHQPSQRGLGGLDTVVAGVLVAKGLGNLIMRLLPMWQCGVQVDARANLVT